MTKVDSTTYKAQCESKVAIAPGIANSTVHVISGSYEADSLAANDIINLAKLPQNAVIHEIIISTDALGTGVSLDIGDGNDADRYYDGIDVSASKTSNNILINGLGYIIGTNDNDDVIQATVLGAAATGTLKFAILYAI